MPQDETKKIDDLAVPEARSQDVKGGAQNILSQTGPATATPNYNPYITVDYVSDVPDKKPAR